MHDGLWRQLAQLDPADVTTRGMCDFRAMGEASHYLIPLLTQIYQVRVQSQQITPAQSMPDPQPAGYLEQGCILSYLINAQPITLAGKLVQANNLPGGEFFFRGIHQMPTAKLQEAFGGCPAKLIAAASHCDYTACSYGDASIELLALPRIPITIIIWAGDKEFDARTSILFDQTAANHLPLDALGSLANLTVGSLIDTASHS